VRRLCSTLPVSSFGAAAAGTRTKVAMVRSSLLCAGLHGGVHQQAACWVPAPTLAGRYAADGVHHHVTGGLAWRRAGAVQRYRPAAPARRPGKAEVQIQAPRAVAQLVLHGRQVPGLLPDVRDRARLCLCLELAACWSDCCLCVALKWDACFVSARVALERGVVPDGAGLPRAQHDRVQPLADGGGMQ